MDVEFGSVDLRRCFERGAHAIRRWNAAVARGYVARVQLLYAVGSLGELQHFKAVRLRPLPTRGDGFHALHLADGWELVIVRRRVDAVRIEEVARSEED